jgi:hypothetical protein
MKGIRKSIASVFLGLLLAGSSASAAVIYDNSANDLLTRFNPGLMEVGDEIILAGTERYLTHFDFEYWGTATGSSFAGSVQARVRFYENNGPLFNGYPSPGVTPFFDSGWFDSFTPTPRNTLVFTAGSDFPSSGLFLPSSTMTFSVQFQGLGAGDALGLDLYSPTAVGGSYPDYWENNGGWSLKTNVVAMNFGARFYAEAQPVPEPTSASLLILGAIAALAVRLRK